jgi:hypothetical protein
MIMSFQIKRSNKSVVVVKRWYVDGIQKEKHIMTIEPYTTSERLHELQNEFRDSKGKIPKKKFIERKDKIVRLSDTDIEKIEDSLEKTKKYQYLETDKEKHEEVTKRITETPTDTRHKKEALAAYKKFKPDTPAEKRKKASELAAFKKKEAKILAR